MSDTADTIMDAAIADAAVIEQLAALPPLEADRLMEAKAKERSCSVGTLRREVAKHRSAQNEAPSAGSGSELKIEDPESHPEPVNGVDVLDELCAALAGIVVMSSESAVASALWVAFGYSLDAGIFSPRLLVKSPEKRCGKTTFLDALTEVCLRPLPASNISAAALFRTIEKVHPTVILDEAETFMRDNEELRGLVNSGHRRSHAYVVRLASVGDDFEPRKFSTWCPMAIAGIGNQHGTIEDRSVIIELKRKMPGERVRRMDEPARRQLHTLARKLRRWTDDHLSELVGADPQTPTGLHDRAADNWRPLLAVADAVGGDWPRLARAAALKLSGSDDADGLATMLLEDARNVFAAKDWPERVGSKALVSELVAMADRPWPEASRGKPLTEAKLARLLKPFGIAPIHSRDFNGYTVKSFMDAWGRYLSQSGDHQPFNPSQTQETCVFEPPHNPSPTHATNGEREGLEPVKKLQKHWAREGLKGSHPQSPQSPREELRI